MTTRYTELGWWGGRVGSEILIQASGQVEGVSLVTHDSEEFRRVEGLRVKGLALSVLERPPAVLVASPADPHAPSSEAIR